MSEELMTERRGACGISARSEACPLQVYSLMDSLRLNQMEVKKQQREGELKVKKLLDLEKTLTAKQIKVTQGSGP